MENTGRILFEMFLEYAVPILKWLGIGGSAVAGAFYFGRSYGKRKAKAELRIKEADAGIREMELELARTNNLQSQITLLYDIIDKLETRNKAIEKHNSIVMDHNDKLLAKNKELTKNQKVLEAGKEKCARDLALLKNKLVELERNHR